MLLFLALYKLRETGKTPPLFSMGFRPKAGNTSLWWKSGWYPRQEQWRILRHFQPNALLESKVEFLSLGQYRVLRKNVPHERVCWERDQLKVANLRQKVLSTLKGLVWIAAELEQQNPTVLIFIKGWSSRIFNRLFFSIADVWLGARKLRSGGFHPEPGSLEKDRYEQVGNLGNNREHGTETNQVKAPEISGGEDLFMWGCFFLRRAMHLRRLLGDLDRGPHTTQVDAYLGLKLDS